MHSMLRVAVWLWPIYMVSSSRHGSCEGCGRKAAATGFCSYSVARHATSTASVGRHQREVCLTHLQVLLLLHQRMRVNVLAQLQSLRALYKSIHSSAEKKESEFVYKSHLHCSV
ncbi:hypothetical protein PAHAL_7G215600 [Panicum hallii]|uniref:Secreted protein n=1 Tax=Panicum hallii TaxID=206008 RepID=A0A2S3I871_9POAL|nr:hypothetical protein PAHAL_7G215600 [Panicum hallii]